MSTLRETFLKTRNDIKSQKVSISDNIIYRLLINAEGMNSFTELITNFDKTLANPHCFERNLAKVLEGQPLQYVLGEAPFIDLDLYVNSNVLIPRPETEGLVMLVQKLISDNSLNHDTIADVCTGSGCIALYMKYKYPNSRIIATDLYEDALAVARSNSERHKLFVDFMKGDKLQPMLESNIKLDVLISNPPYVENQDDIQPIVKNYEPMYAVYSEDGLAFYKEYFKNYKKIMNKKFVMAFEINYDQKESLTKLIGKYFKDEDTSFLFLKDIYDKYRYLIITGGYDVKYFEI
jgi:release factor glutamine methyltransferase